MAGVRCRVKFVINPNSAKCVTEKYFPSENLVVLKLMVHKAEELLDMIKDFGKLLDKTYNWNIEWNWKNVPADLQKNEQIKQNIYAIFSNKPAPAPVEYPNPNFSLANLIPRELPFGSSFPVSTITAPAYGQKYEPPHLRPMNMGNYNPNMLGVYSLQDPDPIPGAGNTNDLRQLAAHVVMCINNHGKNPPMSGLVSDKAIIKAHNYIINSTGRNDLTKEQTMKIADMVSRSLYGSNS